MLVGSFGRTGSRAVVSPDARASHLVVALGGAHVPLGTLEAVLRLFAAGGLPTWLLTTEAQAVGNRGARQSQAANASANPAVHYTADTPAPNSATLCSFPLG